jgi:predicted DNA-binding WGR domain protein
MANLTIEWSRVGPPRPESRPVPPVSMRLNGYVLDYDDELQRVVYLCGTGYDGFGEAWTWDGSSWEQLATKLVNQSGEGRYQGYWDPTRKAMIACRYGYDYDSEQHRPVLMAVDRDGARPLPTSGEFPLAGEDHDLAGAFGFDRARGVGVCLTSHGVWTLDADAKWSKAGAFEGVIPSEWHNDAGAVWNPVRKTVIFWIYENDDYTHVFLEWDGTTLTRIAHDGLPLDEEGRLREFHIGLFNPSACFAGHPRHGVLLHDGPRQFAWNGERWRELPASDDPPPRMQEGHIAYDPVRDAIVLGPGYHEDDPGGREAQRVFFEQRAGRWSKQGVVASDSPVARASKRIYFTCGGESFAASPRELWTWAWRPASESDLGPERSEGVGARAGAAEHDPSPTRWREEDSGQWVETFSESQGDALMARDWAAAIVDMGDHALAISRSGKLYRFDGSAWTKTKESIPDFSDRSDFLLARRGDTDELIVWGGEVKNRKSNDTFFRKDGAWHKNKKASPRPADFAHGNKDGVYVDFEIVWDGSLQRVVRFGFDEVATLEGELWQTHVPKNYAMLAGSRRWQHLPVHDPETGETLLVNLEDRRVLRFDLAGCVEVAKLTLPEELEPKQQHDTPAWGQIRDDIWADSGNRSFEAQFPEDCFGRYRWDLRPAFEAAAKLGPRTTLGATAAATEDSEEGDAAEPISVCLYLIEETKQKLWVCSTSGNDVVIHSGKVGGELDEKRTTKKSSAATREHAEKQIASKRAQGWVDARKLKAPTLAAMVAVESQALTVGKARKRALDDHAIDRIGGMPTGISAKDWPEVNGEPAGFLVQIDTTAILRKHAGVAVFCVTDGTATEDEDNNVAVLIKPGKWAKDPIETPPEGVVPLAVRPLTRAKPKFEIVESRVQALGELDPELAAAVERFGAGKQVHGDVPYSKVGGQPHWVQGGGELEGEWLLVAQLDFDGLSLDEWDGAGLFGVLYILVSRDEQEAVAMWEYT